MSAFGYTQNFKFTKINYQTQGWHTEEYANQDMLDGLLENLVSTIPFVAATGAVNTYAATYNPVVAAYVSGLTLSFKANLANTGAVTLNVNGLGAKAVIRDGAALVGGEILAGSFVRVVYDGTQFLVVQPINTSLVIPDGTIVPAKLTLGHPVWDASSNLTAGGTFHADGNISTGATPALVFSHADTAQTSAKIYYSTLDPSGGADGDIWIKHA